MSRTAVTSPKFELSYYIAIARFARWPLNLVIFPGAIVAALISNQMSELFNFSMILAFVAICCAAFANYSINEYLDAPFDALHPEKKQRPGAQGFLQLRYVLITYALLAGLALGAASLVNDNFLLVTLVFLLMGVIYNVGPIRSKDKPYVDILSESINNPLRFLAGWLLIPHAPHLPVLLLISCWMIGAFLMTLKRYAEYRYINNPEIAGRYRASFRHYSEEKLLILAIFFVITAACSLAVFLYQFNPLLLITLPLFAFLFAWYTKIAMQPNSPAQHLEHLFTRQPKFSATVLCISLVTLLLLFV